jgi:hypothetical protein
MSQALIFGGYGTFGGHVARELARLGIAITVAGRNRRRAEAFVRQLGSNHGVAECDVTQVESCRKVLAGHTVAVNCAGPFASLGPALLESCLETGLHYVDIADDRRYTKLVRSLGEQFAGRKLTAVYGWSSLPAISCSLALLARQEAASRPERARLTLFIGDDNEKGPAAVCSVVGTLGNPIVAPQGIIHGFRDREVIWLTDAFGARSVFNLESPEYDLLPGLLGVSSVSVKVGFRQAGSARRQFRWRRNGRVVFRRRLVPSGFAPGPPGWPADGRPALRVCGGSFVSRPCVRPRRPDRIRGSGAHHTPGSAGGRAIRAAM